MESPCIRQRHPASKCQIFCQRNNSGIRRPAMETDARAETQVGITRVFTELSTSLRFFIDCKKI
jgi:hypothetical protein